MKFIHLVFILLLLAGCKGCDETAKPENKKPEPTTDGRNTFYCEINGVPYYQKFVGGQSSFPEITGSYDSGGLDIDISYPKQEFTEYISFFGKGVVSKGLYKVDTIYKSFWCYYRLKNSCSYIKNYYYNSMFGWVNISRFDSHNGIFSGTFDFKIWLPDSIRGSCDTVKITNGIFDIKL